MHGVDTYIKSKIIGILVYIYIGPRLNCSSAILKYLVTKYKLPDHWYPSDLQRRAKIEEYLGWHPGNTRNCAKLIFMSVSIISVIPHYNYTTLQVYDYHYAETFTCKSIYVGDIITSHILSVLGKCIIGVYVQDDGH